MTILHGKSWQMLRCSLCALPITNRLRFILVTTTSTNGRSAAPCQRGVVSRIGSFFYSNTFGILPSTISPWCVYCISAYIYIYIYISYFTLISCTLKFWRPGGRESRQAVGYCEVHMQAENLKLQWTLLVGGCWLFQSLLAFNSTHLGNDLYKDWLVFANLNGAN